MVTTTPPVDVEGLITDDLIAEVQYVLLASGHSAWGSTSGLRDVFSAILPGIVAQVRREAFEQATEAVSKIAQQSGRTECCGFGIGSPPECCAEPLLMVSDVEVVVAIRALQPAATGEGEG